MKKFTSMALALSVAFSGSMVLSNLAQANTLPADVKLATDQTFYGNLQRSPSTLDPSRLNDLQSHTAAVPLFDTLVRQNGTTAKYEPSAAESYSVSDDGLTWTFHLRPDAKWQDGVPVTADDFVYSWRRISDPVTASPYGNYLASANVKNAKAVYEGKLPATELGVKALDKLTLQVTLTQPTPWFPQMTSYLILAPERKDLIEKYGDSWTNPANFVGNGPYKLTKYVVNDHMEYKKWDGYWNAKNVHITDINYIFLNNVNTAYLKYLADELDITPVPPSMKPKIHELRPDEVVEAPLKTVFYLGFNTSKVPYPIRQAVQLLVDKRFLTSKILKSNIPTSIFAPDYVQDGQLAKQAPFFTESMSKRRADAIKILDKAGYTKSHPFTLTLMTSRSPTLDLVNNALRSWVQKFTGGRIIYKTDTQEAKIYYSRANSHDFQARLGGWGADYDQVSTFYNILRCNDPNNSGAWCNSDYDKTVMEANNTVDATKRAELYAKAAKIIQTEVPVVTLFWNERLSLKSPAIGGYNPVSDPIQIRDLYIIADKKVEK